MALNLWKISCKKKILWSVTWVQKTRQWVKFFNILFSFELGKILDCEILLKEGEFQCITPNKGKEAEFNYRPKGGRFQCLFSISSWLTSGRTSGHQKLVTTFPWRRDVRDIRYYPARNWVSGWIRYPVFSTKRYPVSCIRLNLISGKYQLLPHTAAIIRLRIV